MVEEGRKETVKELLESPQVKEAQALEISIHDAVHYRLITAEPLFVMTELHLEKRHPGMFTGYATIRNEVEQSMRGSSLLDKIAACCTRNPDWLDGRQILYSTELEVWMDMSYPNPWALELYHAVLMADKAFVIPRIGQFSETFHTLLKEKNEYELTSEPPVAGQSLRILVGDHPYAPEDRLILATPHRPYRVHPFASEPDLGSQLANGILEKDIEEHSCKGTADGIFIPHSLGFRLIGPSLLPLMQVLLNRLPPVGYVGAGAEFLRGLAKSLAHVWPALPEISEDDPAMEKFSLFPMEGVDVSLFPDPAMPEAASLVGLEDLQPVELVLPPLRMMLKAALEGPAALAIQASVAAFIREYGCLTRGLEVYIPTAPLARQWRETALVPEEEVLEWGLATGALGKISPGRSPWKIRQQVEDGPWPTATFQMTRPLWRWWLKRKASERVRAIRSARESV